MRKEFLNNEYWVLTFGAAFQRANVYKSHVSDEEKSTFKNAIRKYIENHLIPQYSKQEISDDRHIENIYLLSQFTETFSTILQHDRLNFGVCQKLLNLYLKYLWCADQLPAPPHFPIDRRIQENIAFRPIVSWTQMNKHEDYMQIINFARNSNTTYESIAEFELHHFERRFTTSKQKNG